MELLGSSLSILALLLHFSRLCRSQTDSFFYDACAPLVCGNVSVAFPFSSSEVFCGLPGYEIACDRSSGVATITLSGNPYQVDGIYRNESLIVVSDTQLIQKLRSNSCDGLEDHFLPAANFTPLELPWWNTTLNLAWCPRDAKLPASFTQVAVDYSGACSGNESLYVLQPLNDAGDSVVPPPVCTPARLPVSQLKLLNDNLRNLTNLKNREILLDALAGGFPLQWQINATECSDCEMDGGRCGYNRSSGLFVCFCKDGCGGGRNQSTDRSSSRKVIILAAVVPTTFILLAGLATFIRFRTKVSSIFTGLSVRSLSRSGDVDVQGFIKTYRSMLTTEYSYPDVKKITDGFKEKLGGGGYGDVYKGKLPNGQLVAVKILEKSKDNGWDFVNEVATIGMIHHNNIIRLLGFCCDGSHRALFYEFMPKGSLGDLISKEEIRRTLEVPTLLEIAVGIARGIEYLHQGCDKRILHLDIKPHNVLLDNSLHPKISDFGLAKLYSREDSVVPLTVARGTVGYIAPEMFMSNLGGVSHKSDVYSYGMLLLEMILGRQHARGRIEKEQSSKEYFPDWIYDQLDQWAHMDQLQGDEEVVEEEIGLSRKMVMVGLWCIQTNPTDRPSIGRALAMLTGGVEHIKMPPKPLLFAPSEQQPEHVSIVLSSEEALTYYTAGTE